MGKFSPPICWLCQRLTQLQIMSSGQVAGTFRRSDYRDLRLKLESMRVEFWILIEKFRKELGCQIFKRGIWLALAGVFRLSYGNNDISIVCLFLLRNIGLGAGVFAPEKQRLRITKQGFLDSKICQRSKATAIS